MRSIIVKSIGISDLNGFFYIRVNPWLGSALTRKFIVNMDTLSKNELTDDNFKDWVISILNSKDSV